MDKLEKAPLGALTGLNSSSGMKGEGGDEEIKLHGNRLVLAGQTAAVYCSTLCRRAHAKLKAPSRPVLLCPGPRQRLVEKCRRLPIWMRVIAALAACLLIKVRTLGPPSAHPPATRSHAHTLTAP